MLRAIVIDDNPRTRALLSQTLSKEFSVDVKSFSFLLATIDNIKIFNPNMVFIDFPLSSNIGLNLLIQLRGNEFNKDLIIVVMASNLDEKLANKISDYDVLVTISKPYKIKEIINDLSGLIEALNHNEKNIPLIKIASNNQKSRTKSLLHSLANNIQQIIIQSFKDFLQTKVILFNSDYNAQIFNNVVFKSNYLISNCLLISFSLVCSYDGLLKLYSIKHNEKFDRWDDTVLTDFHNMSNLIFNQITELISHNQIDVKKQGDEINFNIPNVLLQNFQTILFTTEENEVFGFTTNIDNFLQ